MSIKDCEVSFIENIALPIYRQIGEAVPELADLTVQIEDNKRQWSKLTH